MTLNIIINLPNRPSICKSLNYNIIADSNVKLECLSLLSSINNTYKSIPTNVLFEIVKSATKIDTDFRLIIDGCEIINNQTYFYLQWCEFITVTVLYKLLGGKGGFGATLRGAKGRKKTSFNIDSCRDLQGRRIRQTRLAEQINKWKESNLTKEQLEILKTTSSNPTSYPEPITNSKGYKVQFSLKEKRRRLIGKLDDSYMNKKDIAINSIVPIDTTKSQSDENKETSHVAEDMINYVETELNSLYGTGTSTSASITSVKVPTVKSPVGNCDKMSLGAKLTAALIKN
ncbi:hypothetical protein BmR1_04g05730 [Babesia microti strain RI]|uniref:SDE2-like domain-containing protein n=1 Tax=Babesia microti (strain RI) TaxID=1133968 RepID=I7I9N4_BABMR|nr:hypothetical protein BmR1_04g05730 [Babesia microti strain RI]CCF75344.1 hypothetical protein BmR1_04g05730 [Babesia microti strain RI]|eukprot:XP_012649752.1 hypothetical protein BmR1_04g05730 [Babesia microti strain RI]